MSRRFRVYLPIVLALPLALSGTVALGATASAATAAPSAPAAAPCTAATPQVQQLTSAVTSLSSALSATPPDLAKLTQAAGSLVSAVTAAATAGCLPALPTTSGAPTPASAQACLVAEVQLLQGTLGVIAAGISVPPNLTAALQSATALVSALTSINSNKCLPVSLPVPTVPTVPPVAPPL